MQNACPGRLAEDHLCVLHYTLLVEQECAEMRRESALGKNSHERQNEFMGKIADRGETLVHVATSGFPMSDELKARILSTLLTLMNSRENLDRAVDAAIGAAAFCRVSICVYAALLKKFTAPCESTLRKCAYH